MSFVLNPYCDVLYTRYFCLNLHTEASELSLRFQKRIKKIDVTGQEAPQEKNKRVMDGHRGPDVCLDLSVRINLTTCCLTPGGE